MSALGGAWRKLQTAGELVGFFGKGRWWILPMIIGILLVGVLIVLAETTSLGPFLYTMF
jgi:hypothetical protein